MGRVVDLEAWRLRRLGPGGPEEPEEADGIARLERAIVRLDPMVARLAEGAGGVDRVVETELLAITGAVSIGLVDEAAERAERLRARLEHPTLHRSG